MSQRTLPHRSEIDPALCWDLTHLFADETEARQEIKELEGAFGKFKEEFPPEKLAELSPSAIVDHYEDLIDLMGRSSDLALYASLWYNQDLTHGPARKLYLDVGTFSNQISTLLSPYESVLADLPATKLQELADLAKDRGFDQTFAQLLRNKPQRLDAATEKVLAAFGGIFEAPYGVYETAKATDLVFDPLELSTGTQPLSYVLYENDYSVAADTELRRKSFAAFSKKLGDQRNTLAALYNAHIQREKVEATLRGFDSVIDYLLHRQDVTRDLYDRQIDGITRDFAPTMRRYAELLRKELGLETMTFADLKAPLDPELDLEVSIEAAVKDVEEALAVMGPEYQDLVMRFRQEGWVDFAQNIGKSTGGFCAGSVKAHPYILLSWTGRMSEVFTLIHELGHAAQDLYGIKANKWTQASPSMYLVEAPSTMHELLLARSLMEKHQDDPRLLRWVLDSMISKTYYHNFVTHLLEADYQREVYRLVDQGENLTADDFDRLTRESLERFWGEGVEITEGAERTWMRQPHYYMGLYPYTYSAGLTLATGIFQQLTGEDEGKRQEAVQNWIRFLEAGGSHNPLELAKIAGFDLSSPDLLQSTLGFLDDVVTKIEELI